MIIIIIVSFQAFLPVYLYVLDSNDNKPVFLNTPYIATVQEVIWLVFAFSLW